MYFSRLILWLIAITHTKTENLDVYVSHTSVCLDSNPCDGSIEKPFNRFIKALDRVQTWVQTKPTSEVHQSVIYLDERDPGVYFITGDDLRSSERDVYFANEKSKTFK